jgi:hypothetical protein
MRTVLIGFDSAWTDKEDALGGELMNRKDDDGKQLTPVTYRCK